MGIGKQNAKTCIDVLKAQTTTKQELRDALGEAINRSLGAEDLHGLCCRGQQPAALELPGADVLQAKAFAMDAQLNSAAADFAASKPAQFKAHVDALPDVGDPTPDPVP